MSTLKLKVQKYRRFLDPQEIDFQSGLTIISGSNGAGKSTLVEAILFALFGAKRGVSISDMRPDKTRGDPHVECELLIDDQVVKIVRDGNAAEVAINGVVQVMRGSSSGRAASAFLTTLLGGLTRSQFESSYIALQGDTAGLVEFKAKDRRILIEKILQLELLARAVEMQTTHSEIAKNQIIGQGNVICSNELPQDIEAQAYIENFQNARVLHTRVQYTQQFQTHLEQVIADRQCEQHRVEARVTAEQDYVSTLQDKLRDHLSEMGKAKQTYQQLENLQESYNELQASIAGFDGKLTQVKKDIGKLSVAFQEAEQFAKASAEYAQLLEEKDDIEKRLVRLPLVQKCYKDFEQARERLAVLDRKLEDAAGVDEELCLAKEQENQSKLHRDALYRIDPTAAEFEIWQKQENKLELEMQQNKQALQQLKIGTDDARCPTCEQPLTQHTLEIRVQHLTIWLNETWPPLHQALQERKQRIDEQKKQWEQAKRQAEEEYEKIQENTKNVEKRVHDRDTLREQRVDLQDDFLAKQHAWLVLEEKVPDEKEEETLNTTLKERNIRLGELKTQADAYEQRSYYQQSLRDKEEEQEQLEKDKQDVVDKQRALGFDPVSLKEAKDLVEKLRERETEIREQHHQAEFNLQNTQGECLQLQRAVKTLQVQFDQFCTYVQEYYKQEHLREHMEDFKKHFFEANTGEVMRRTTWLLMHAVTDQSILGVRFDKDEFQYLDASNIAYPVSRLSGGEKALVGLCLRIALAEQAQAIARTGRVKFLILDEVLSSLDDERCDAVQRIFADVQKRGIFEHIIMITHLDSVKQGWRANGLVVQKVDGKISTIIPVSPGEVPKDGTEGIEV